MITGDTVNGILVGGAAILGSGGLVAIIHEFSVRRKVKADTEAEKAKNTTELMKYFTDEIKRINEQTKDEFDKMREENKALRKDIKTLNSRITDLVRWILFDNASYRSWLENTLKSLDPDIDIPICSEPPLTWHETDTDSST